MITSEQVAEVLGLERSPEREDRHVCPRCSHGCLNVEGPHWYCHRCLRGGGGLSLAAWMHPEMLPEDAHRDVLSALGIDGADATSYLIRMCTALENVNPVTNSRAPRRVWIPASVVRCAKDRLWSPEGEPALVWLTQVRKLSLMVIEQANLGWSDRWGGSVVLPFKRGGGYVGAKFRVLNPTKMKYGGIKGQQLPLFMGEDIVGMEEVILTEGEMDALAMRSYGFKNVAALPNGAGGKVHSLARDLVHAREILIVADADEAGVRGAYKLAMELGPSRARVTRIPRGYNDPGECLQNEYPMRGVRAALYLNRQTLQVSAASLLKRMT